MAAPAPDVSSSTSSVSQVSPTAAQRAAVSEAPARNCVSIVTDPAQSNLPPSMNQVYVFRLRLLFLQFSSVDSFAQPVTVITCQAPAVMTSQPPAAQPPALLTSQAAAAQATSQPQNLSVSEVKVGITLGILFPVARVHLSYCPVLVD